MLRNYLLIAFRNLLRYKLYAFINIFGLSIGIAFCILIALFVQYELTFDAFHVQKENIYRVEEISTWDNEMRRSAILPCPLAPAMAEEIPEIKTFSRYTESRLIFALDGQKEEQSIQYVDPDFFRMFSFELLSGDPEHVLLQAESAVISEAIAEKYFGDVNPIGKHLHAWHMYEDIERDLVVTGVIKAAPDNSSLQTDILLSMEAGSCAGDDQWPSSSINAFVLLHQEAQKEEIIRKSNALYEKYYPFDSKPTVHLTALPDIYFDEAVAWFGGKRTSNPQLSYILSGIALLLLMIACINYVLLTLTNATSRSKEVGIRKVLGASKSTLRLQYLSEAQLLTFIALLLGLTLAQLFLPAFETFTQKELSLNLQDNISLILVLLGILLLTGLAAGSYPAYYLSHLIPAHILKGKSISRIRFGFSHSLVMLQLAVCIFFISCTLIMNRQLSFMAEMDLGFDRELIVKVSTQNYDRIEGKTILERFQQALMNDQDIEQITGANAFPGFGMATQFQYQEKAIATRTALVDYDFFSTLGIEMAAGRSFSPDIASDSTQAVIINEALADALGYADPIGEIFPYDSSSIIGMVKDVHMGSLERKVEPAFFRIGDLNLMLIKIDGTNIPRAIQKLEQSWQSLVSDQPLDYTFLDEEVNQMYAEYLRWQRIISLSTLFGILIACMGLFGLSGLHAARRSKEIAIRKVLGAGILHLLHKLNQGTVFIAALAALLAIPFAYYAMHKWLQNFAYRIDLQWYWFGLAFLTGACIALTSVSYHTLKATLANPVDSLKYE